jgi:enoyl-CoA hydratase
MDLYGLFELVEQLPVPVVAAVQGKSIGGGFELALVADLTVASSEASFTLPETNLGLAPGIAMVRLHRQIGLQRAKLLAFTGATLSAQEALELGLVVNVVAPEDLSRETFGLAWRIARRSPIGVRVTKRAMNRESAVADWRHVRTAMSEVFDSEDLVEGLSAFRERRSPTFQGV